MACCWSPPIPTGCVVTLYPMVRCSVSRRPQWYTWSCFSEDREVSVVDIMALPLVCVVNITRDMWGFVISSTWYLFPQLVIPQGLWLVICSKWQSGSSATRPHYRSFPVLGSYSELPCHWVYGSAAFPAVEYVVFRI